MLTFICPRCNTPFRIGGKTVDKLIYHKYTCTVCHSQDYFPLQHFKCSNCGNSFYLKKAIQEYADSIIKCPLCENIQRPTVYRFTCTSCGETRLLAEERANSSSRAFHCTKCGARNSIDPNHLELYTSNSPIESKTDNPVKDPVGELNKFIEKLPEKQTPVEQGAGSLAGGVVSNQGDKKTTLDLEHHPQRSKIKTHPFNGGIETVDSDDVVPAISVEGQAMTPFSELPQRPKTETYPLKGIESINSDDVVPQISVEGQTTTSFNELPQRPENETYPLKGGKTNDSSAVVSAVSLENILSSSISPVNESPRIRRLRADEKAVAKYCRNSKYIRVVKINGNPPDYYVVEYRIRGVERIENNGADVIFRDVHQVEIRLDGSYPRSAPVCRMLTPIFHPNIEPAMICIGDDWSAQEKLADLIVRIGEMITYQSYNVKSPLDGFAAQWAEINSENFPIDNCDLFPFDDEDELSLVDE